jgi:hypothetical protein
MIAKQYARIQSRKETEVHDGLGARLWAELHKIKPTTDAVHKVMVCLADIPNRHDEYLVTQVLALVGKLKGRRIVDVSYENILNKDTNPIGDIGTIKIQLERDSLRWWDYANTMTRSKNYAGRFQGWKSGYVQWLCYRNGR